MFEAIEYIEVQPSLNARNPAPSERSLGTYESEEEAIEAGRVARQALLEVDIEPYAWWIVRRSGARLAHWIADSHTDQEFVLDLSTGQLIEVP